MSKSKAQVVNAQSQRMGVMTEEHIEMLVRLFQREQRLPCDGVFGDETRRALEMRFGPNTVRRAEMEKDRDAG